MPGQLNAFQLSMLQWNDLHPYNAVHVVRVPCRFDPGHLKRVITGTLEGKGLAMLTLNRSAATYEYHGGAAEVEIKLIPDVAGEPGRTGAPSSESASTAARPPGQLGLPPSILAAEIERQINTPFATETPFTPFRFFVAQEREAFWLGLVYFHSVADGESIVLMLKELVDACRAGREPNQAKPVERYPSRHDNLLLRHPGVLARKLASLPRSIRNMRSTCRPHYRDAGDPGNKFTFFSLTPRTLGDLIQAAKSWGVTLNDLFLALLLQSVPPQAARREPAGRRRNFSLGCIVNTRKELGMDRGGAFGLFLGSFVVHHAVPAGIGLAELARDIGRQTLAIKQRRLYLGTALELTFGRLLVSLFSGERRRKLYQKHYPLWGGLTNMNLNKLWPQPDEGRPVDYFRAVSTGPATPLVASITTVGEVANIGLTWRTTVFGSPEIERIKARFLDPPQPLDRP